MSFRVLIKVRVVCRPLSVSSSASSFAVSSSSASFSAFSFYATSADSFSFVRCFLFCFLLICFFCFLFCFCCFFSCYSCSVFPQRSEGLVVFLCLFSRRHVGSCRGSVSLIFTSPSLSLFISFCLSLILKTTSHTQSLKLFTSC